MNKINTFLDRLTKFKKKKKGHNLAVSGMNLFPSIILYKNAILGHLAGSVGRTWDSGL